MSTRLTPFHMLYSVCLYTPNIQLEYFSYAEITVGTRRQNQATSVYRVYHARRGSYGK